MNTGLIASRYARALYKWTCHDAAVCSALCTQAGVLEAALSLDKLRNLLKDNAVPLQEKLSLLESALSTWQERVTMLPELKTFLCLVNKNGRMAELRFILASFRKLYYAEHNTHFVKIVAAHKPSEELLRRLESVTENVLGGKVVKEESIDESLIGGILIEADGYRYDASVRAALDRVSKEYEEMNRRII